MLADRFTLPFEDPVLIVTLAMGIFLVVPLLFERYRVPSIIGLILAGAVAGPNALNLLARDPTIVLLGTVGLLYLVFQAGLELDLHRFAEYRQRSLVFGGLSFGIPLLLAVLVMPLLGFGMAAAVLIGSIIGSHTLLAYPIVSRLGITRNAAVTMVVGGTLVTDTLALGVLAVVSGVTVGGAGPAFWVQLIGLLGLYAALALWGIPRLGRWFFRNVPSQAPAEFIFLMLVLFASSFLADLAGAEPIIGAFLAGLMLNRLIPESSPLMNRVRFVGSALFVPFFLLSVGMLVDFGVLAGSARVWLVALVLIALVHLGKFAAAALGQKIFGYSGEERSLVFGLSVPQAAATLAVTFVGLEIGLFGGTVVNAVIVMILVTGLVGPSLVEHFGRQVALDEEKRPYRPSETPRRILIPLANPKTEEGLLDLAFLLRGPRSDEPVYPLRVVREGIGESTEAQVAEAEKLLGHAVIYSAGADVPVIPLTRVDQNIATGIARGIAETRSSTVVVGWDARRSGTGVFGSVLDQVLEQTQQTILVAKLGHPLNTTERLVLVLPPLIDRHPGAYEALRDVKVVASQLGAAVLGLVLEADTERYRETFERIKPEVPARFDAIAGWDALLAELRSRLQPEDLVVTLSARRGTLPWDPRLERLPGQLAGLLPESFLMIYPSEIAASPRESVPAGLLPGGLEAERILTDLPTMPYAQVLEHMLETAFARQPPWMRSVVQTLVQSQREYSTEVRPGVVVPHAIVDELQRPILILGISTEGIEFPEAHAPAQLIFLLLSPATRPQEHLNTLATIARLVSREDYVQKLLATHPAPAEAHVHARDETAG